MTTASADVPAEGPGPAARGGGQGAHRAAAPSWSSSAGPATGACIPRHHRAAGPRGRGAVRRAASTTSASSSSTPRPRWRSCRRSTRASRCPPSRPWRAACRWWPPPAAPCPRWSGDHDDTALLVPPGDPERAGRGHRPAARRRRAARRGSARAGPERVLERYTWAAHGRGHRRAVPRPSWPRTRPGRRTRRRVLTVDYDRLGLRAGDRLLDLGLRRRPPRVRGLPARAPTSSPSTATHDELDDAASILLAAMRRRGPGAAPARRRGRAAATPSALPFPDGAVRPGHRGRGARAHPRRHARHRRARRGCCGPGGTIAVTVPRWFPELVCWALSDDYHAPIVPGGHVRIYRRPRAGREAAAAGLRRHRLRPRPRPAHAVLVAEVRGRCHQRRPSARPPYHRFLVWDITDRPARRCGCSSGPSTPCSARAWSSMRGNLRWRLRQRRRCTMLRPETSARLRSAELEATVDSIAGVAARRRHDPVVPRRARRPVEPRRGGHGAHRRRTAAEAERAYEWLSPKQRPDGAWHQYYVADGSRTPGSTPTSAPTSPPASGTTSSPPATSGSSRRCGRWSRRAMDFVLDLQAPRGEIHLGPPRRRHAVVVRVGVGAARHLARRPVVVHTAHGHCRRLDDVRRGGVDPPGGGRGADHDVQRGLELATQRGPDVRERAVLRRRQRDRQRHREAELGQRSRQRVRGQLLVPEEAREQRGQQAVLVLGPLRPRGHEVRQLEVAGREMTGGDPARRRTR